MLPSTFHAKSKLAHFLLPSKSYAKSVQTIVFQSGVPNSENYQIPIVGMVSAPQQGSCQVPVNVEN
jgi:hypothetical protein